MIFRDSRQWQRQGMDEKTHFALLDNDVDELERSQAEELKALRSEVRWIRNLLIGMLLTTTTAAIGLAINAVLIKGG